MIRCLRWSLDSLARREDRRVAIFANLTTVPYLHQHEAPSAGQVPSPAVLQVLWGQRPPPMVGFPDVQHEQPDPSWSV
jgi:hypothetical protein